MKSTDQPIKECGQSILVFVVYNVIMQTMLSLFVCQLDDKAIQHREVQGNESKLFKSYFESITILKGG